MNDKEKEKVLVAVRYLTNIEGQIDNFLNRAKGAAGVWTRETKADWFQHYAPDRQAKIKKLPAAVTKLAAEGKTTKKEIAKIFAECADKPLGKYADAKDFWTKFLKKKIVPVQSFTNKSSKFVADLYAILDSNDGDTSVNYPGCNEMPPKAAVTAIKAVREHAGNMAPKVKAMGGQLTLT